MKTSHNVEMPEFSTELGGTYNIERRDVDNTHVAFVHRRTRYARTDVVHHHNGRSSERRCFTVLADSQALAIGETLLLIRQFWSIHAEFSKGIATGLQFRKVAQPAVPLVMTETKSPGQVFEMPKSGVEKKPDFVHRLNIFQTFKVSNSRAMCTVER